MPWYITVPLWMIALGIFSIADYLNKILKCLSPKDNLIDSLNLLEKYTDEKVKEKIKDMYTKAN